MAEVVRYTKKFVITLVGVVVVCGGLLMSLPGSPGPGILIVLAGLAILATEYIWAQHLLEKLEQKVVTVKNRALNKLKQTKED